MGLPGLAWLALPRRGSSRRQQSQQQPQLPRKQPQPQGRREAPPLSFLSASSGVVAVVVAVVVAAADETSHAEARRAKPSQASQSREGLTNGIGYFCDQASGVIDPKNSNIKLHCDTILSPQQSLRYSQWSGHADS